MKVRKVTYMGRDISGRFTSLRTKLYKAYVWVKKMTIVTSLGTALVLGGYFFGVASSYSFAYVAPERIEVVKEMEYPVLDRIADCESGTRDKHGKPVKGSRSHFDSHGQVLINESRDMGIMQINVPIWGKTASAMGLDLSLEKDNKEFGKWLYANHGTEPWYLSKSCWK